MALIEITCPVHEAVQSSVVNGGITVVVCACGAMAQEPDTITKIANQEWAQFVNHINSGRWLLVRRTSPPGENWKFH